MSGPFFVIYNAYKMYFQDALNVRSIGKSCDTNRIVREAGGDGTVFAKSGGVCNFSYIYIYIGFRVSRIHLKRHKRILCDLL